MRGRAQFDSHVGRSLFATTNRMLWWIDLAVADQKEPIHGIPDWPDGVYASWLADFSARLSVRVAQLGRRVSDLIDVVADERDDTWKESLKLVIHDTVDTDHGLQCSYDNAPEEWRWWSLAPSEQLNPSTSTSDFNFTYRRPDPNLSDSSSSSDSFSAASCNPGFYTNGRYQDQPPSYPRRIDVYTTPFVATLWNSIRCIRLHLLAIMKDLFVLLQQYPISQPPPLPSPAAMRATVNTTVDDVCASVPLLLGDIDTDGILRSVKTAGNRGKLCNSITLMWSLHKICRVPGLDPRLKEWIVKMLERIGTVGELRQTLNLSKVHGNS